MRQAEKKRQAKQAGVILSKQILQITGGFLTIATVLCYCMSYGMSNVAGLDAQRSFQVDKQTPEGVFSTPVYMDTKPVEIPLSKKMQRISAYLTERYDVSVHSSQNIVKAAQKYGKESGIDPILILAMAAVESGFDPLAQSIAGAVGLMQIIPRYHGEKLRAGAKPVSLLDPLENIRVGTLVLKEYLQRYGTMTLALQQYNGALNDPLQMYAGKVLLEKARLEQVLAGRRAAAVSLQLPVVSPTVVETQESVAESSSVSARESASIRPDVSTHAAEARTETHFDSSTETQILNAD